MLAAAIATAAALLAVPAATSASTASDPCTPLAASNNFFRGTASTAAVVSAAEVFACYSSFSVNQATRTSQVDILKQYFALYPYLDIAKASTSPYFNSSVNLYSALDSLASDNTIDTEFGFYTAVAKLIASLNDAHLVYYSYCFLAGEFAQPFVIDANYSTAGSPPKVYIRAPFTSGSALLSSATSDYTSLVSAFTSFWRSHLPADVNTYTGYTIKTINGVDAVTFIQRFADEWAGVSHVPEARFNYFMPSTSWNSSGSSFSFSDGSIYLLRMVPSDLPMNLTYVLSSPVGETVTLSNIPWAAYVNALGSFTDRNSYYQTNCVDSSDARSTPSEPSALAVGLPTAQLGESLRIPKTSHFSFTLDGTEYALSSLHSSKLAAASKASVPSFDISLPVVSDAHGAFYMLDNTTGVWVLPTFEPVGNLQSSLNSMVTTMTSGLTSLQDYGASKLIIDASGNSGGIMCVGTLFLEYLMSNPYPVSYDMLLSDSMATLVKYADYSTNVSSNASLFSTSGLVAHTSARSGILANTESLTRGGSTSTYSDKFDYDCTAFSRYYANLPALKTGWSANAIFLVTDGYCGSTCAQFVRALRDDYGVTAFTYAGSSGTAFQPSAFEGGSVGSYAQVVAAAQAIQAGVPASLLAGATALPNASLPLPVTGTLPIWEAYSRSGAGGYAAPAEWVPEPAERWLAVADRSNRSAVWVAAAAAAGSPTNSGRGSATPTLSATATSTSAAAAAALLRQPGTGASLLASVAAAAALMLVALLL
ncbi:hypothetical protein HK405_005794 [Cladochytrium tenue]|nr:hypothetical protein HK405_005794 [Cladochytrium tenue]